MHKEEFIKALKKLNINVTDKMLTQLDEYYRMIIDYNSHTNLTRITEEKEVYILDDLIKMCIELDRIKLKVANAKTGSFALTNMI